LDEFSTAEGQIRDIITVPVEGSKLTAPQGTEGHMVVKDPFRPEKVFRFPAQFATYGLLAYTLVTRTTQGFLAAIGSLPQLFLIFAISPLINKVFEQVQKAAEGMGEVFFREQLRKRVKEQWVVIDGKVNDVIKGFFADLSDKVDASKLKAIQIEQNRIDKLGTLVDEGKISELEIARGKLDAAAK